jgi:hypothetical protein
MHNGEFQPPDMHLADSANHCSILIDSTTIPNFLEP